MEHHDRFVSSVSFSWDGSSLASVSNDKSLVLSRIETNSDDQNSPGLGRQRSVRGQESLLHTRTSETKLTNRVLSKKAHDSDVSALLWLSDDTLISTGTDKTVKIWKDRSHLQFETALQSKHDSPIYAMAFDGNKGGLFTASTDGVANGWDVSVRS